MSMRPALLTLQPSASATLESVVNEVVDACPGQTEFRYVAYLRRSERPELAFIAEEYLAQGGRPLVLDGLPKFDTVEATKILALTLGEAVGSCVGYADYNHSYITDIRPTPLSNEKSAGFDLLGMHNDLAWADDVCRPRTLVLVPHVASGDVPRTLLAPSADVLAKLDNATLDVLAQPVFEARTGGSLAWKYQRIERMPLLSSEAGHDRLKLNFDTFVPAQGLDKETTDRAAAALREAHEAALNVGTEQGHAIQKGQALLIPNDHCAHGRDPIESGTCERLLLRSYVVPRDVASLHPSTMLQLSH
jgi:hypothetical protein